MPVIVRDAVASDHLVYAWPFPIGPEELDVSCADDELVVLCPAWLVGDRLGPGRHRWRTPDPTRPVSAYFVLTAPVEVSFDMSTQFMIPTTGQAVRVRATGSLQVRCLDPALLVAQFVGLPFDSVNDGVLRSVSRSIERMLARLLTRRVVMAGTPQAVTDPGMLQNIVEELVAYNPTAGAVFGIELMRIGHVSIVADDGSRSWHQMNTASSERSRVQHDTQRVATVPPVSASDLNETARGTRPAKTPQSQAAITPPPPEPRSIQTSMPPPMVADRRSGPIATEVSGEINPRARAQTSPPVEVSGEIIAKSRAPTSPPVEVSGEIIAKGTPMPPSASPPRPEKRTSLGHVAVPAIPPMPSFSGSDSKRNQAPIFVTPTTPIPGTLDPNRKLNSPPPRRAGSVETMSGGSQSVMRSLPVDPRGSTPGGSSPSQPASAPAHDPRGSIMGIGVSAIGAGPAATSDVKSGEIAKQIGPGARVLVPGPNGLMQSATVRQLLQGYLELEVGGSGETIWVPVSGVVPE